VRFDAAGLHAAVGTAGGRVALFDLRSPRPLLVKDHMYGAPIVDIKFHAPDREAGGARARRRPHSAASAPRGRACMPCELLPDHASTPGQPQGVASVHIRLAPAERAWVPGGSGVDPGPLAAPEKGKNARRGRARAAGLSGRKVVSADRHIVRVWDALSGEGFTSVQPAEPGINDVLLWPDAGLLMLGMDAPRIQARRPAARPARSADSSLELRARATMTVHAK
jgi:hypothetical protein